MRNYALMNSHLDEQRLAEIQSRLAPLLEEEERATRWLEGSNGKGLFHLALCNVPLPHEEEGYLIPGIAFIRPVSRPPGLVALLSATRGDEPLQSYLLAQSSHLITCELVVEGLGTALKESKWLLELGWNLAVAFKLKGLYNLFSPGWSSVSWNAVASKNCADVKLGLLDDYPRLFLKEKPETDLDAILSWTQKYWEVILALRAQRRFGLALNQLYSWNQYRDPRISLAAVWVGLEALFSDKNDDSVLRSIVERVEAWVPEFYSTRVEAMYELRCAAVHGRDFDWRCRSTQESLLDAAERKRCMTGVLPPSPTAW